MQHRITRRQPSLPTIPEHPTERRRYRAGDRLMVLTPDGRQHTACVVQRIVSGTPSPVLWLRLDNGTACPLSPENVTVLARLR